MTLWYVCTHSDYQRQGIATKLFSEIEKIAITNNCELIYFISGVNRKKSHNFYKKQGYKSEDNIAFIKYL